MTVMDTFYTVFKSTGAEKVVKDQKTVDDSLKKMKQDFDDVDDVSDRVSQSFGKFGGQLVNSASKALLMVGALAKLKSGFQYAVHLDIASQQLGVNTEDLDAWGRAVERTGGNLDTFKASLQQFAQNLGTNGATALKELPQFADTFQKLGQFGAMKYGKMIGLDEATILLLMKGNREVSNTIQQQKELGVVTKQDAETARAFNNEWLKVTQSFEILFMELAVKIMPTLKKFLDLVIEGIQYLRHHMDFLIGTLGALGIALTIAKWRFILLTGVIGVVAVAIGALYEDIKAFVNGSDSLIGRLINRFEVLRKSFDFVKDARAKWKYELGEKLTPEQQKIIDVYKSGAVKGSHIVGAEDIKRYEASQLPVVTDIPNPLNSPALSADDIQKLKASKEFLKIAGSSPINNQVSNINNAAGNKTYNFSVGDINIHTQASDLNSLTQSIDAGFKEQLRQVLYNFDDGVQG